MGIRYLTAFSLIWLGLGVGPFTVSSSAEQFTCSRCGRPLVRCPKCGKFRHPPQDMAPGGFRGSQSSNPPNVRKPPQNHAPIESSRPIIDPFEPARNQPEQKDEHRDHENLEELKPIGAREPLSSPAVRSEGAPRGYLFKAFGSDGRPQPCNGFIAGKHRIEGATCEYPIGTAEHCLSDKGGFGEQWIRHIEIEGKRYEPIAYSRPQNKLGDVALMIVRGACDDFPDDRVYAIDESIPPPGSPVGLRKSAYWKDIWGSLGYGDRGEEYHAKHVAEKVLSARAVKQELASGTVPEPVIKVSGDTIEPGDSGAPVAFQGKICGILSGSAENGGRPPFTWFTYSPGASMAWMKQQIKSRYGENLFTRSRAEMSFAVK